LITTSDDKHVKTISVENRKIHKCFGWKSDIWIRRMKITADGEKLLVGGDRGDLQLRSSRDGKVIKDFGRAHWSWITGIIITLDQKFWFSSSSDGVLKQWNYKDNTLARDHGEITNPIYSLCL
jgi:WD40 repeat protein